MELEQFGDFVGDKRVDGRGDRFHRRGHEIHAWVIPRWLPFRMSVRRDSNEFTVKKCQTIARIITRCLIYSLSMLKLLNCI